jgi:hypothetical protein
MLPCSGCPRSAAENPLLRLPAGGDNAAMEAELLKVHPPKSPLVEPSKLRALWWGVALILTILSFLLRRRG